MAAVGLVGGREAAQFLVCLGRSFDECHVAIFAVQIESAIGVENRCRPDAAFRPDDFAGQEFHAHQRLAIRAIHIIAHLHDAADRGGQLCGRIDFFDLKRVASLLRIVALDLDQSAASFAGGAIDIVAIDQRRGDIGGTAFGGFLVAPQELAGFRIDADDALGQELNILLYSRGLADDDRRIGCLVATWHGAFPDHVARLPVERNDGRIAAAWGANQFVAIDQRRFGIGPYAGFAMKIIGQVLFPENLAGGRLEADQVAVGTEGVEHRAIDLPTDCRRGPCSRIRRFLVGLADFADMPRPELGAILDRTRFDEFVVGVLASQHVEPIANDGRCRIAGTGVVDFPEQLGTIFWPFLQQTGFLGDSVPLRPSPLRPITGNRWRRIGGLGPPLYYRRHRVAAVTSIA